MFARSDALTGILPLLDRTYDLIASTMLIIPGVGTMRLSLKPELLSSSLNSVGVRSTPPGAISISRSIILLKCGSLPSGTTASMMSTTFNKREVKTTLRSIDAIRSGKYLKKPDDNATDTEKESSRGCCGGSSDSCRRTNRE